MRRLLAVLALLYAAAAGAGEPVPGTDFRAIMPALPAAAPGRIEVVEFFWYGCPHCYDFESVLVPWRKTLPADVVFRRVPALLRPNWTAYARLYYSFEALGLTERLHAAAFQAIHEERLRLDDEEKLLAWVAAKGIDPARFAATYHSEAVQAKVRQARELAQRAGVTGVPALMVQGRYMPINEAVDSYEDLARLTGALIQRVRSEAARK